MSDLKTCYRKFVDLQVSLEDSDKLELLRVFVKNNLDDVSQSVFETVLEDGLNDGSFGGIEIATALYHAVLNHQIVKVLEQSVASHQPEVEQPIENTTPTSTEVFCNLQVEGLHYWLNCDIEEVAYLSLPHRHVFHITAFVDVSHDDRDVEFIKLKHNIKSYLEQKYCNNDMNLHNFGGKSCEMIGKELMSEFNLTKCIVSEDNENGSIVIK